MWRLDFNKGFIALVALFCAFVGCLSRVQLGDTVTGVWFANWAQYRETPYTFDASDLAGVIDDVDIIYYGFAFFCPNSSMFQPYWVTELNYCVDQEPFDVIYIEPMDPTFYEQINAYKSQNPNLKLILSVGGWNFPSNFFSQMVSAEESRSKFIASAVNFTKTFGFDGIDIDWEYPGSKPRTDTVEIYCDKWHNVSDYGGSYTDPSIDKANFVSLMKEMREAFDQEVGTDAMITFCSQAGLMHVRAGFDLEQLTKYVDLINIMTYDYTVSDTNDMNESLYTAPNEPLYSPVSAGDTIAGWNLNQTINGYLEYGAPADQLLVGIAYYGHDWYLPGMSSDVSEWGKYGLKSTLNPGNCCGPTRDTYGGQPGQYTYQCGSYAYYEIMNANCPTMFDNETMTYIAYCSEDGSDGFTNPGTWINYQGTDTIKAIINFTSNKKLRGAFGFDVTMDSYDNGWTFEVTKLMNQCVKNNGC